MKMIPAYFAVEQLVVPPDVSVQLLERGEDLLLAFLGAGRAVVTQ